VVCQQTLATVQRANLEALETREIDGYVATGRTRDAIAGHVKD
jgi:hypothetical protein